MFRKRNIRSLILPAFILLAALVAVAATDRVTRVATLRAAEVSVQDCYSGPIGATAKIPAGRFRMGSLAFYPEETPIVSADVAAFDIDVHEVTNSQFEAFVKATGYVTSAERATDLGFDANGSAVFLNARWSFVPGADWRHPDGPGSTIAGRDREPVVQVSLQDAQAYAKWAGRRLPTEAEYEYAARGGLEGAEYPWGNDLRPDGADRANTWQGIFPFADTADDGHAGRAPVGCYAPSSFGTYDMIGNVWEWTSDAFYPGHGSAHDSIRLEHPHGVDPRQPGLAVGVIKGGSYLCADNYCQRYRPAARHAQDIMLGTNHIGFRTAGDLDGDAK